MQKSFIKNFDKLATTLNRKIALNIVEAGLISIDTESVILKSTKLQDNTLSILNKSFDLSKFKNIKVVGFGKASIESALAVEKILGSRIKQGAVIGLSNFDSKYIEIFAGTHPRPSEINFSAGKRIYEIIKDSNVDDLIIVLVSGGGSSLLCYPESECMEGAKLYDAFLGSGKTINEMNTVRKHLSLLKGGGLAKLAYPATVIGLIFSDVPGDDFEDVASGPTYKDKTTMADAVKIITENNLGDFNLIETPKDDKYFENVHNFVLVSNKTAVEAMAKKAQELSFYANIVSTELYDETKEAFKKIFSARKESTVVLAAGEPKIMVTKKGGKGGRNLHMGLEALKMEMIEKENSKEDLSDFVFISFATDGMDNSDVAGAVVDKNTIEKGEKLGLNVDDYLERFDSYNFFEKTGDLIVTGSTGANVSDLMILLNKKN